MDSLMGFYRQNQKAITIVVSIIVVYFIFTYMTKEDMDEQVAAEEVKAVEAAEEPVEEVVGNDNEDLSPVPAEMKQTGEIHPDDLLPVPQNIVDFNSQFPKGEEQAKDKNFLIAGYNIGINTVASSLKNANQQLRSDPYIPRQEAGPWNQSTIMSSDLTNRKPFEIGTTV